MSTLKTCPNNPCIITRIEEHSTDSPLAPGDWVKDSLHGGRGMIVAIDDEQVTVLWNKEPLPPGMFPQTQVSLQPMSMPKGAIFYQDFTYGTSSDAVTGSVPAPEVVADMNALMKKWVGKFPTDVPDANGHVYPKDVFEKAIKEWALKCKDGLTMTQDGRLEPIKGR